MFDQTFVDTAARTRKPWTVAASLTVQMGAVAALLLLPILHPEALSLKPPATIPVIYQVKQPPPQLVPSHTTASNSAGPRVFVKPQPALFVTSVPSVLLLTPDNIGAPIEGTTATGPLIPGGLEGLNNITISGPVTQPKPQPKPEPQHAAEKPTGPIQVSTGVQASKLISGPHPIYPTLAKQTRTQGTVRIQAIIAEDGSIQNLKVLAGPPLLVQAALEAVSRWRYQPTLLNGKPVQVIAEISVNFTLNQ